jgi:hypothetical protein
VPLTGVAYGLRFIYNHYQKMTICRVSKAKHTTKYGHTTTRGPCVNTEAHGKDDLRRALGKHDKEASTYAPKRTTKMIFVVR